MVKKIKKYLKFVVCCALIMSLVAPSYAALSASDGSAFVTKAEFDSALADFNARLTTFEAGINSKIDSQVTSYLDRNGIWNGVEQTNWFGGIAKHYGTTGFFLNGWTGSTSASSVQAINVPSGLSDELRSDLLTKTSTGWALSQQIGNTQTPGTLNYLNPNHASFNFRYITALIPFYNEYTNFYSSGGTYANMLGVKWNDAKKQYEVDPTKVDESGNATAEPFDRITSFKLTQPIFTPSKSGLAFLKGKLNLIVPTNFTFAEAYTSKSGRNQLWIGPMVPDTATCWMGDYDGTYPPDKGMIPKIESSWAPPDFIAAYDAETDKWGYDGSGGGNKANAWARGQTAYMALYPSLTINIEGNLFVKKDEPITLYMSWQALWNKNNYNKAYNEGGLLPEQKFFIGLNMIYNGHFAAMPKAVVY